APLLREVNTTDLLGRQPIRIDLQACDAVLRNRVVLVTGGCGSIGSELCRQIASFRPSALIVLDNNESALFELDIELRLKHSVVPETVICDITDPRRLNSIFRTYRPQVIFHAAAYKHVPLMERHPEE